MALTPSVRRDAWVATPGTRSRKVRAPPLAGTTSRPVGSGSTQRIGPPAPPQRRVGAESAVLLARHAGHQEVAAERGAGAAYGRHRGDRSDEAGLHVARAAAVQLAGHHLAGERVRAGPGREVAGRHHVHVPVEQQAGSVAAAGQPPDETPGLGALDLDAGEVRRGEQLVERQPPVVHVRPGSREVRGEHRLDLVLGVGAAHAGHPHELGQPGLGPGRRCVDLVEHSRRPVGHRTPSLIRGSVGPGAGTSGMPEGAAPRGRAAGPPPPGQ